MYAVGRPHPHRDEARDLLRRLRASDQGAFTSAEVLQEFVHAYLPVGRLSTLDSALLLARSVALVRPIEESDVMAARDLHQSYPALSGRDLIHLAVCFRYDASDLMTFDRALAGAWRG